MIAAIRLWGMSMIVLLIFSCCSVMAQTRSTPGISNTKDQYRSSVEVFSLDINAKYKVMINTIGINVETPSSLNETAFDSLLAYNGYSIHVPDFFALTKIRKLFNLVRLRQVDRTSMDIRYSFQFYDGEKLIATIYADPLGQVLFNGNMYVPKPEKRHWLSEMMEILFSIFR